VRHEVTQARRIVVKLGTHVVTHSNGEFALGRVGNLVESLAHLHRAGHELLVVSSGAVGLGRGVFGLRERPRSLGLRQACAAAGQGRLMAHYDQAFSHFGVVSAQVLLTQEDFADNDRTLCLRTTLLRLLELKAVPILNENDSVSVRELIGHAGSNGSKSANVFGDNDELAARVALCVGADLLILLTDVDGVFDANPNVDRNAKRISIIESVNSEHLARTAGTSAGGTGGMASKIRAAKLAQDSGIDVVIARGGEANILERCLRGEDVGTWIVARERKAAKLRRRAKDKPSTGILVLNGGAVKALLHRKSSLLPIGVIEVKGEFTTADWVELRDASGCVLGHGQANYDAHECRLLAGQHSERIGELLGWVGYDALVNRQNMDLVATSLFQPETPATSASTTHFPEDID
jgi:glutamate 5-kinase